MVLLAFFVYHYLIMPKHVFELESRAELLEVDPRTMIHCVSFVDG
jgi:hypothetical protein